MKICEKHWELLVNAIRVREIFHLVSPNAEEANRKILNDEYDPLLDCALMISHRAIECGGQELQKKDKEVNGCTCPICEAVTYGAKESFWINGPADASLETARQLGLVAPLQ